MKKVLVLLFLSFLSIYANFEDRAYTNYDRWGNTIIIGKIGKWNYKQEVSLMYGYPITSFTLLDDLNNTKIFMEFGKNVENTYISIESKVIENNIRYYFFMADSINKNYKIKAKDDYILEYLERQNIYNGIVQFSGLDAYNLIFNKFMKYYTIILYKDYEDADEVVIFNLVGLDRVFEKLVLPFKN